ncbi:tetratricopeptide repeat protein [Rhodosalinus sp.]|uniref:tetratricopeptide repeat protein n=1 Tax=Rhodosalinus sp. TaxID=2047741 RepID=UPI00397E78BC
MRRAAAILLCVMGLALALPAAAQDDRDRTLADIRQDLSVLFVEIQRLRRELSTTGGPSVQTGGDSVLDRVNAIESELQRLTARTEELDYRIQQIVEDGTRRIGDLEFRLVELEGGDTSQLDETTTLGGDIDEGAAAPAPDRAPGGGAQLAVGEQADFEAAQAALDAGEGDRAAELFRDFRETYPGSPLEPRAYLGLGRALEAAGDMREAARTYLDGFSAHPEAEVADETLYRLGLALGALDRVDAACPILADVELRFPASPYASRAQEEMGELSCP